MSEAFTAPKGKYRVVSVDISAATGFGGADPEDCGYVIRDTKFLWFAKYIVHSRWISFDFLQKRFHVVSPGSGFDRQIQDDAGECVYHRMLGRWKYDWLLFMWDPRY